MKGLRAKVIFQRTLNSDNKRNTLYCVFCHSKALKIKDYEAFPENGYSDVTFTSKQFPDTQLIITCYDHTLNALRILVPCPAHMFILDDSIHINDITWDSDYIYAKCVKNGNEYKIKRSK